MSETAPAELVTLTIDGIEVSVPKGTTVIRAAESIGIAIPRFCDHPLLAPRGSCRMCLVEIPDAGNGRGFPAPQTSCTMAVAPGMVVQTQLTSPKAKAAQEGIMELLLINHPLDCPICDKGGECPLQNQAMSAGRAESRFDGVKRRYEKPVKITDRLLLDRERCVLCARCTRFAEEIAGDPFISLAERGAYQQVGSYPGEPFDSVFSGNVVQICPVGAFTAADYRFNARPFDLVSVDTTCEQCAAGCSLRADHRHGSLRRRLAGVNPEVNEEWNCDRGRFHLPLGATDDRPLTPLLKDGGAMREASWPEALAAAAAGLRKALKTGVLPGPRQTAENAAAFAAFARDTLGTPSIDYRVRVKDENQAAFLLEQVKGKALAESVQYRDLENAAKVVLVDFDPEADAPIVFLRLFKGLRKGLKVVAVAAEPSRTLAKLKAELVETLEDAALDENTIVLAGERCASETLRQIATSPARWAWIPNDVGAIGAIDAGCLPGEGGLDVERMLNASMALVVGDDAVEAGMGFTVRLSDLGDDAAGADVWLPVATVTEQSGTFLNWEHRRGSVGLIAKGRVPAAAEVLAHLAGLLAAPETAGSEAGEGIPDFEPAEGEEVSA
ncbi:MAG: (2Fe-2S)-binding protein [Propionibacteriaceae bacterium]|jgi:NADH-quinone oxidoreductase subunit G|nr:(2Fe-2S)-binding protein [Propionibacteriaceae bacterium]